MLAYKAPVCQETSEATCLKLYNKTGIHLLFVICKVTSSEAILPVFPNSIGCSVKRAFRVV